MTLEEQIRAQGGDWNIGGFDRAAELADLLRAQGVTSLGDMKVNKIKQKTYGWMPSEGAAPDGGGGAYGDLPTGSVAAPDVWKSQLQIGDKTIGFAGDYNLDGSYGSKADQYLQDNNSGHLVGWSARGDGNVGYQVVQEGGKTYIIPHHASSSDLTPNLQAFLASAAAIGGAGYLAAGSGGGAAAGAAGEAAGAAGGAAAPSAGAYGAGLGAETAAGLVAPGAAGGGGALLAAPGAAGAAAGGGLLGALPSWLPEGLAPAWDFIKGNPKLVGALAGGLLGGVSGGSGDEPAPYTGPMPTITRGGWQADARSGYTPMTARPSSGLLGVSAGTPQAASGMHRYMGLLGG